MRASLGDLELAKLYAPPGVRLTGGARQLEVDVEVTRGEVAPGSAVRLTPASVAVRTEDITVRAPLGVVLEARPEGPRGHLRAEVRTAGKVEVSADRRSLPVEVGLLTVAATTSHRSFAEELSLAGLEADLRRATVALRDAAPWAPKDMTLAGGTVELSASVRDQKGQRSATAAAKLETAAVEVGDVRVGGDGSVALELTQERPEAPARGSLRIDLSTVGVRSGEATATSPLRLDGTVEVDAARNSARMPFRLRGPSGDVIAASLGQAPWLVRLGTGLLVGAAAEADGIVSVDGGGVALRVAQARAGGLTARGALRAGSGPVRGAWLVRSGVLSVGLRHTPDGLAPQLFASEGWLAEQLR